MPSIDVLVLQLSGFLSAKAPVIGGGAGEPDFAALLAGQDDLPLPVEPASTGNFLPAIRQEFAAPLQGTATGLPVEATGEEPESPSDLIDRIEASALTAPLLHSVAPEPRSGTGIAPAEAKQSHSALLSLPQRAGSSEPVAPTSPPARGPDKAEMRNGHEATRRPNAESAVPVMANMDRRLVSSASAPTLSTTPNENIPVEPKPTVIAEPRQVPPQSPVPAAPAVVGAAPPSAVTASVTPAVAPAPAKRPIPNPAAPTMQRAIVFSATTTQRSVVSPEKARPAAAVAAPAEAKAPVIEQPKPIQADSAAPSAARVAPEALVEATAEIAPIARELASKDPERGIVGHRAVGSAAVAADPAAAIALSSSYSTPVVQTAAAAFEPRIDTAPSLIERIEIITAEAKPDSLQIAVDHDVLGQIDIGFESRGDEVVVEVHAADPSAARIIAESTAELRTRGEAAGLRFERSEGNSTDQQGAGRDSGRDERQPRRPTNLPHSRPSRERDGIFA